MSLGGWKSAFRLSVGFALLAPVPVRAQAPPAGSGTITVQGFVRVIDGDSLEAWIHGNQVGIGLIGIAAPRGNSPCGKQATEALQGLLKGGVRLDEDLSFTFDARKRRMYYAKNMAGLNVASEMAKAGVALADGRGREAALIKAGEAQARANKLGCLWSPGSLGGRADTGPGIPENGVSPSAGLEAQGARLEAKAADSPSEASDIPSATVLPSGFSQETVASGFANPTAMTFLPDGRILVAEKSGTVRVVKNGAVLSTPFIDIRDRVNDYWDHGLIGIAADPNFATNNYVYLLYTYENDQSQYVGTKTARLTRVTAVGDTASPFSEVVILGKTVGASCNDFPAGTDCISSDDSSHSVGNIKFAPDGTMFVTVGDGASFNVVDDNALRSQNLDLLTGKILHIDANGNGLPSNPFWNGNATANRSKVWGYGLRNPFRFNLRPGGVPYLGDVGWSTWEEINVVPGGSNMGWPCYEGSFQQSGYAPKPVCQALYSLGPSAVTMPLISWNHNNSSAAAVGGAFYTGTLYPSTYQGVYFFGDYAQSVLRYVRMDANDNIASGPFDFATGMDGPVDVEMGPDGNLYYLAINAGAIRRIRYSLGNTPPTAVASATPTDGVAPLTVRFSSAGSSDPDGNPLTYSWNFGDGSAPSTSANPQHTYSLNGKYTATLTVNDGRGGTGTASVVITVGNRAPTATISAPSPNLLFRVGDVITYSGSATDPEDGTIPASGLAWEIILHHCPGGVCHVHPFTSGTGTGGTFTVPDHGDDMYFEIVLTATDRGGLTGTTSVQIQPQTVQITLATTPPGLQIVFGGESGISPLRRTTIVGSIHTVYAPSPQTLIGGTYAFSSWSDQGAQQHDVTVGTAAATFTANFVQTASGIRVNSGGVQNYTDPSGNVWVPDTNYLNGQTYTSPNTITGTTTPVLYQAERFGDSGSTLQYQFPVSNATYTVTLKFAEVYFTQAGKRVFNVAINGQTVLTNFDIFAQAGGANIAIDKSFTVPVTNGQVTIQFIPVIQNAKISAIQILPASGVNVSVSPTSANLGPSQTQQFTATVTGSTNTSVTWSLNPQTGAVSSTGLYTAPSTITSTQTVSVIARSVADTTKTASATVTLTPAIAVSVSPPAATLTPSQTQQFSATVTGTANTGVTWSISPQTGTISSAGLYTAPSTITTTQTVTVTARSVADTTKSASATVTLSPGTGGIAVSITPTSATLTPSQTQQFSATVTGTANTSVTWSISPQTGTISSAGLYTAPSTITSTQTVTVTARSVADTTKSASATVTLMPASTSTAIRVNSGGAAYTDPLGQVWSADTGFLAGSTYGVSTAIANTTTPTLYQTERWNSGTLQYQFSVPNGTYTVNLKFAEIYFTAAGQRVFSIVINGQTVLSNFDIVAQAGAAFTAIDKPFNVSVTGGQITIQLVSVVQNPKISAIEIVPASGISVSVSPASVTLGPSQTQQFTASVTGTSNTAVTWSLSPQVGTITSTGLYAAPSTISGTQTVTVRATSAADGTKVGSATVTLSSGIAVSVSPASVTLTPSQSQQFTATVTGTGNAAVTWSLSPQVGTISSTGLYAAPATVTSTQTITVRATSAADTTKSGTASITLTPSGFSPIRVNSGGASYTDPLGQVWAADNGFSDGNTYATTASISGTTTPTLYQSERWSGSPFQYQFSVPNGTHTVTLKFAEIFFTQTGQRVFNVTINGQAVLTNFDIVAQAGGAFRALDRPFTVSTTNGLITIGLSGVVENPKLSAIEIK